jgi:transcription antitermination factor NusG
MNWFALTVRPQHEEVSSKSLTAYDVQSYLPLYSTRRRWSDRYKTVDVPLIPGYVFARFARTQRTTVLRAHGVRSIVQFGGEPAPIPESELDSIRALIASGYPLEPWAGLVPGEKVRIETGPLAGAEGVFVKRKNACCLAVSIDMLGRSVIATVDPEAVIPLKAGWHAAAS